jgi:hypothetical protein
MIDETLFDAEEKMEKAVPVSSEASRLRSVTQTWV